MHRVCVLCGDCRTSVTGSRSIESKPGRANAASLVPVCGLMYCCPSPECSAKCTKPHIRCMLSRYDLSRGPLDLVIIVEPCSFCEDCMQSLDWKSCHIRLPPYSSDLAPSDRYLPILSSEVVPRWQWDQTGHWVLSHWTVCNQNSIWLASKSFFDRCNMYCC